MGVSRDGGPRDLDSDGGSKAIEALVHVWGCESDFEQIFEFE